MNVERRSSSKGGDELDAYLEEQLERDEEFRLEWERQKPKRDLATEVLKLRSEHEWNQRDLAERMGTSQNYIYSIENGEANPTVETLQKLAHAFGRDLDVHISGTDSDLNQAAETLAEEVAGLYDSVPEQEREALITQGDSTSQEFLMNFAQELVYRTGIMLQAGSVVPRFDVVTAHATTGLAQRQRELIQDLAEKTADAYVDFLQSQLSHYHKEVSQRSQSIGR